MIVDLMRNDLGRVCRSGSIEVPQLVGLESYRQVHHLTSVVTGQLSDPSDLAGLLRACWPGGSITGAPKSAPASNSMHWSLWRAVPTAAAFSIAAPMAASTATS